MNVKEQRKRFHLTRKSSSDAVASGEMLHSSEDGDTEYPHWVYEAAKHSNISSATAVAASFSKRVGGEINGEKNSQRAPPFSLWMVEV